MLTVFSSLLLSSPLVSRLFSRLFSQGTFEELVAKGLDFADLLAKFVGNDASDHSSVSEGDGEYANAWRAECDEPTMCDMTLLQAVISIAMINY